MIEFYDYKQLVGHQWLEYFLIGLFFSSIIGLILLLPIFRRYLAVGWKKAFVILFLTLPIAYYVEFNHYATQQEYWKMMDRNPLAFFDRCLTPGLFILCIVPFTYRLIAKWFFGQTTEAERTTGWVGVRAWLCPSNLICALLVAYSYTASHEFWGWNESFLEHPYRYFLLLLCLLLVILLAYRIVQNIRLFLAEFQNNKPPKEDQAAVQSKILELLSTGKITPQECVDLLTAVHKPANGKQADALPPDPPEQPSSDQIIPTPTSIQ